MIWDFTYNYFPLFFFYLLLQWFKDVYILWETVGELSFLFFSFCHYFSVIVSFGSYLLPAMVTCDQSKTWRFKGQSSYNKEQTWLHIESISVALTFVLFCLCLVLFALPHCKSMWFIASKIQESPFLRLWPLKIYRFPTHTEIKKLHNRE